MPPQVTPDSPTAAYVHVPFCVHRCGYCDFTLVARRDDLIGAYLDALEIDLITLTEPQPVQTLFLGGGTPTHLPEHELARMLELVKQWFPLLDNYEFSVEANPAGLTVEKIQLLADAGVNRISLGAQSFDVRVLKVLERDHSPQDIRKVVETIRRWIPNVSLDLIFGVPGQTLESWQDTIQSAVALQPCHLSAYGLTFEKGTAFWTRREQGQILQVPDELERSMYAAAMELIPAAGLLQYEISNYARPGLECQHNQTYWQGRSYWGFGPGAARYLGGRREMNHRSVTTWIKRIKAGQSPIMEAEELSPEDRARELCVLGLRMTAGIDRHRFRERTSYAVETLAGEAIQRHLAHGFLEETPTHFRLTKAGRFVADTVVGDFL